MEDRMRYQIAKRRQNGSLRKQLPISALRAGSEWDFSTNDYLGLAQCQKQKTLVDALYQEQIDSDHGVRLGATGSRLLSGDSFYARNLEEWLAKVHQRPTATIFNSGYDANLSILSSTILPGDLVILDELCHNSLLMGVRMSRHRGFRTFPHNSVKALQRILEQDRSSHNCCLIVIESVYSMDGDVAPLEDILDLAARHRTQVVVDEAHGLGIYGRTNVQQLDHSANCSPNDVDTGQPNLNLVTTNVKGGTGVLAALELEHHPALLCSVHTFGKAAGCHGAIICGSQVLRDFLWNYARPFVYSTSLPLHSLITIKASYMTMIEVEGDILRAQTFRWVKLFRGIMEHALADTRFVTLWPSPSPIQALVIGGNDTCLEFCQRMLDRNKIRLYPIRAPTVPLGQERVRLILHAHNTEHQVRSLCQGLLQTCSEMRLIAMAHL
jgi:8-amino-7-oxononanoate synthase